jgi:hypothetical protein
MPLGEDQPAGELLVRLRGRSIETCRNDVYFEKVTRTVSKLIEEFPTLQHCTVRDIVSVFIENFSKYILGNIPSG